MGLDQGFDFYDSPFRFEAFSPLSGSMFFGGASRGPFAAKDRRDGALVVRAALQWLAANRDQPVFVFLHLYDLHKPYKLPGYDAEIQYTDQVLGEFRKALIASGWWAAIAGGSAIGSWGEPGGSWRVEPRLLHLPKHAGGAADFSLAVRKPRICAARRGAGRIDRCLAHHSGLPAHPGSAVV